MSGKAQRVVDIARRTASGGWDFFIEPGLNAHPRQAEFTENVRAQVSAELGKDYGEQRIAGSGTFPVDYYFPGEQTVVEIELGLHRGFNYERDLFKCILACEEGNPVKRLLLIGPPSSKERLERPLQAAIARFAEEKYGIVVDVVELEREPDTSKRQEPAAPQ